MVTVTSIKKPGSMLGFFVERKGVWSLEFGVRSLGFGVLDGFRFEK